MTPPPTPGVVHRLYEAFEQLDAAAMQACYAPQARFSDEVFDLRGRESIGAMWAMLCEGARGRSADAWRLEVSGIEEHAHGARAHWEPHYRFGPKGRLVHNRIDASFVLDGGLIVEHHDRFDMWRWSRQALGQTGWLLGWTPWLRNKVRKQAARGLAQWRSRRGAVSNGASPQG